MGRKIFAIQNGGQCFAEGPENFLEWRGDYKFYGPSEQCKNDGKGGLYKNEVYEWIKKSAEGWSRLFFNLPFQYYRLFVLN